MNSLKNVNIQYPTPNVQCRSAAGYRGHGAFGNSVLGVGYWIFVWGILASFGIKRLPAS
jgi:hypothetical protein